MDNGIVVLIDLEAERLAFYARNGITPEPKPEPPCKMPGCDKPKMPHPLAKYCSPECRVTWNADRKRQARNQRKYRHRLRNGIEPKNATKRERNQKIIALREDGHTLGEIAKIVGLHCGTVHAICSGKWRSDHHKRLSIVAHKDQLARWRAEAGIRRFGDWIRMLLDDHCDRRNAGIL